MKAPEGLLRGYCSDISIVYRIVDAVTIAFGLYLATLTRGIVWTDLYTLTALLGAIIFYVCAESNRLYGPWRASSFHDSAWLLVLCWVITIFLLLGIGYATKKTDELSRIVLGLWVIMVPLALLLWRFVTFRMLRHLREQGYNTRTVAIAGVSDKGNDLARVIRDDPSMGMKLMGFFEDTSERRGRTTTELCAPVQGDLDDLIAASRTGRVDIIYIALPGHTEKISKLLSELSDTTTSVYFVPDFFTFDLLQSRWTTVASMPVISIFETPFLGLYGWEKRLEDVVVSSLVLLLVAVPMLAIAIGVKLSSPGPVLFKQYRYGLSGKRIKVWKFRTMTVTEDDDTVVQATRDDQRVTPFGAFLRHTSLDELPQFINVLMGEMSVVGPRPHAVAHNEAYRGQIAGYMLRHKVKPGITGWAQINGWRGETDTPEKMDKRIEHDLWYIRSWSIWLDLKIVLQTISVALQGKNAY